ncbi:MAG: thiamine pyrophosphate-binding protein [Chloroflexota bacterium]
MSWEEELCQGFKANGIKLICYLPDIVLSDLLDMLHEDGSFHLVPLTREEEGVGILAGGYMGGMRGAMLLQSTGLGNSINAFTSLSIPQQLPFLMLINPRGDLGEPNPFQVPMGRILEPMLDLLSIQHATLQREDEVRPLVDRACRTAFRTNLPVALLLSRGLTGGREP